MIRTSYTSTGGYFVNKKIKYVWDEATLVFVKLKSIDESMTQGDFHKVGKTHFVNHEPSMQKVCIIA